MQGQIAARLDAVRANGGFDPEIVRRFGEWVDTAPGSDLFRTNPYRYAEASGLAPRTAIDLFLHATHAGIFEFAWGVLCQVCGWFITSEGGLKSLVDHECQLCRVPAPAVADENVEVAFTVSPTVRHVEEHEDTALRFDPAGLRRIYSPSLVTPPGFAEFVLGGLRWQGALAAGEAVEVTVEAPVGRHMFVAPREHAISRIEVREGGAREVQVDLVNGRVIVSEPALAAGRSRLRVRNRVPRALNAGFLLDPIPPPEERGDAPLYRAHFRRFLSGKELVTTQAFRELFHADSIPSAGGLQLKNLTVLFTDLKGSTELYSRVGDLRAFTLVREHFGELREVVAKQGGAVVKTIGDAIMASFAEPAPALAAAASMREAVRRVSDELELKIGLHAGPCIAVELNERLDYFGQTVNIAARVQNYAAANQIVVTDTVYGAPGAGDVLGAAKLTGARELAELKGVDKPVPVWRLA